MLNEENGETLLVSFLKVKLQSAKLSISSRTPRTTYWDQSMGIHQSVHMHTISCYSESNLQGRVCWLHVGGCFSHKAEQTQQLTNR